jgi:hypothetical protein
VRQRRVLAGEKSVVSIDLRKDADDLRGMLKDAVRLYATLHKAAASGESHPLVTRIDLVFSLGDGESTPWVHLHLDTKAGSEPDGDPTHLDFMKLPRENWLPAVEAVYDDRKVAIQKVDGKIRKCDEARLTQEIGDFLVSILLTAKADGVFAELPRAVRCELGVEDPTAGAFGWPLYEDRGQQNLV